jgi:hypothetical protein
LTAATSARPTPVLPDVASMIVDRPGCRRPARSAASIIASAGRSLTEPPGFSCSHLASTVAAPAPGSRRSRTSGVRPICARMLSSIAGIR